MTPDADLATTGTDPNTIELPRELGDRVQRAFDFGTRPTTFGEWADRMVARFEDDLDRELSTTDLCDVAESPHSVTVRGETTHYMCAQDPLVVGLLADDPVTVRSEPPTGDESVTVEFDEEDISVDPEESILSFGIDDAVETPDGPLAPEAVYGAVCPHGHAFPDREAYERWAAEADAVTTPLSMAEGLAVMERLVDVADVDSLD